MSAGPEEGAGAGACVLGRAWVPTVTHVFVWAGGEGWAPSLVPFARGGVCAAVVVVGVLASFFCFWRESTFSPKGGCARGWGAGAVCMYSPSWRFPRTVCVPLILLYGWVGMPCESWGWGGVGCAARWRVGLVSARARHRQAASRRCFLLVCPRCDANFRPSPPSPLPSRPAPPCVIPACMQSSTPRASSRATTMRRS